MFAIIVFYIQLVQEKNKQLTNSLWMCVLAVCALRTEPGQVVHTEQSPHVSMSTVGSVSTEAAVVPRTLPDLGLGVDVQERALLVVARV